LHGIAQGSDVNVERTMRPLRDGVAQYAAMLKQAPAPYHAITWASLANSLPCDYPDVERLSTLMCEGVEKLLGGAALAVDVVMPLTALIRDYAHDVLVYQGEGKAKIKAHVKAQLAQVRAQHGGAAPVVFAHSMGSVILVDLMIDWIREGAFSGSPSDWPIHAIVTAGSPLGITVPLFPSIGFADRAQALKEAIATQSIAIKLHRLYWVNVYDPDDPICTGAMLDLPGGVDPRLETHGYPLLADDYQLSTGGALLAHTGYFDNALVCSLLHPLRWMVYRDPPPIPIKRR